MIEDILKIFREEYKKAYKEILPKEVLEGGNSWFEDFLRQEIKALVEKHIKDLEELSIDKMEDGLEIESVARQFGAPDSVAAIRILELKKNELVEKWKLDNK